MGTRNGFGLIYTDTKDSVTATPSVDSSAKQGQSCATNILGLVSTGDMTILAAKKAGGIRRVSSVDYHQSGILGVYGKTCVIVKGD
jgi:hypothetical protein